MVELRYFTYPTKTYSDGFGGTVAMVGFRKLQYRVDPSCGLGHWNEWQDVPEVTGRSDAAERKPEGQ
jgi:hypothetical protein